MKKSTRFITQVTGWLTVWAMLVCLAGHGMPAAASAANWALNVRGAILLDAKSGKVLFEQRATYSIPPASLTKVVTMFVAFDAIRAGKVSLKDRVRVSALAARQGGSRMHLRKGERVSLERLLLGVAVSSGNDAAVAVAEHVAGSHKAFVKMMNRKARELGLKSTVFRNANGLPAPGQLTTARDMAILTAAYLKKHPNVLTYHRTKSLKHRGTLTTNKNPLLRNFPGADGLKTGFVSASGYNIIATVKRGNTRLIGVALGAVNSKIRAKEINRLMDAGFKAPRKKLTVTQYLLNPRQKSAQVANVSQAKSKSQQRNKKEALSSQKKQKSKEKARPQQRTEKRKAEKVKKQAAQRRTSPARSRATAAKAPELSQPAAPRTQRTADAAPSRKASGEWISHGSL